MKIIQRVDLYSGRQLFPQYCSENTSNPTLQNLDTSLIGLLKGNDECGKVNNFTYSEDDVVDVFRDDMELDVITEHDLSYYEGLSSNVLTNAQSSEMSNSGDNSVNVSESVQNVTESVSPSET